MTRAKAKCEYCGKKISQGSHVKKYCSPECQQQAKVDRQAAKRKAERQAALKPRKCEHCGEKFKPTRSDARFCCDSHRAMANKKRKR